MSNPSSLSDHDVLAALQADTPLNRARQIFSSASAAIEQGLQQRQPWSPLEVRRREFAAVQAIAAALLNPEIGLEDLDDTAPIYFCLDLPREVYGPYTARAAARRAVELQSPGATIKILKAVELSPAPVETPASPSL